MRGRGRLIDQVVAAMTAARQAQRAAEGLPPLRFDVVRDLQVERERRRLVPCPHCVYGAADPVALRTHNLRVAEFGERSYRVAAGEASP